LTEPACSVHPSTAFRCTLNPTGFALVPFAWVYYEHPAVHNVHRHYGVVTDRYKLVHFYEPEANYWELFDLKRDPRELRSVYGQKKYAEVQQDLERELARLREELKVPPQDPPETSVQSPPRSRPNGVGQPRRPAR
jgi:hypothetical protein